MDPAAEVVKLGPLTIGAISRLLAEGLGNKAIASTLGITPKTVETHRARIMAKLHMHSMSDLVRYAIRHKLIEP